MNNDFKSLSHPLEWTNILPPNFPGVRLPGGTVQAASGHFGSVCIQQYRTQNYSLYYKGFTIEEDFVLESQRSPVGFYAQLALLGKSTQEIIKGEPAVIHENEWWMAQSLPNHSITTIAAGNSFQALTFHFTPQFIAALLPLFPVVESITKTPETIFLLPQKTSWADPELLELVQSILRCRYEKDWRAHFFDSRAEDVLFKFQVGISEKDPVSNAYTENELMKIYEAERLISRDISRHLIIPKLSKMVLLNESRFKALFKKVYGMGPHEYLRNRRLLKAVELLGRGFLVKEAAAATGWRPADLIQAYKDKYGTTPGAHWPRK